MSTHRFMSRRRKHAGRFILALLLGAWLALLALPSLLPVVAFARASGQTPTPTVPLPTSATPAVRDKAGVSVVRLVAIYGPAEVTQQVKCTGLGILVASEASVSAPASYTNWVLTDSSLVGNGMTSCGQTGGRLALSEIQIWANNAYTQASAAPLLLDDLCRQLNVSTTCKHMLPMLLPALSNLSAVPSPYTLFSFQSSAGQPFLNLASSAESASTLANIGLTKATAPKGQPNPVYPYKDVDGPEALAVNIKDYLTPDFVVSPRGDQTAGSVGIPNLIEGGTPEVNAQGQLAGMWVNNREGGFTNLTFDQIKAALLAGQLSSLPTSVSSPSACTSGTMVAACWNAGMDAFYKPDYALAEQYLNKVSTLNPQLAAAKYLATQAGNKLKNPPPAVPGVNFPDQWVLIAVAAVLFLVLVVVVVLAVRMWRRRRGLADFEAEWHAAERAALQQKSHASPSAPAPQASQGSQVPQAPCPNCRHVIRLSETICPYCRFPLSPSASGAHVRLAGSAPVPLSTPPASPAPAAALPISEQPTRKMSPNGDSGVLAAVGQPVPAYEMPTQDMQPVDKRKLGLVVGTRTDRGLKRKHKPNEDSLFAAQGMRPSDTHPQQFGLFVVADGMGGHANGQDASRLAIQTIVDFLLPKISAGDQLDDQARMQLMGDGVQTSNQAVHERNMEAHADMGTTMTAALVIDTTAYVANVGDSRTYLYREGLGLSKVTHDHSVVASLVEAGIIQPDDIYTHPKRNQIYRSLGEKQVVEVDTFEVKLQPGDKLLLCSDGLWDMTRDPQIRAILGKTGADLDTITQDLIKAALDGGGEDNVSVIVVQLAETRQPAENVGVNVLYKPDSVTVPDLTLTEKRGNV